MPKTYEQVLADLRGILETIKASQEAYSAFHPVVLADKIHSMPAAETLLSRLYGARSKLTSNLRQHAVIFLKERWSRIKHSPICYTINTECQMNWFCIRLAELIAPKHVNNVLMPTVAPNDFFGLEFNQMKLGSFILNDAATEFICINVVMDLAKQSILQNNRLEFRFVEKQGQQRLLTETELSKLSEYRTRLQNIFTELPRSDMLTILSNLRDGLVQGDVSHQGREMEAGGPAYSAIATFYDYYNRLSPDDQRRVRHLDCQGASGHLVLGNILDNLNRDFTSTTGQGVSACVQIASGKIGFIIDANQSNLRGMQFQQSDRELSKLLKETDDLLNTFTVLTPSNRDYPQTFRYVGTCNVPIPAEVYEGSDNIYISLFCKIKTFICHECDRIRLSNEPTSAKLGHYLNLLYATAMQSAEILDRPDNAKKAVVNEIMNRLHVLAHIKSGAKFTRFFHQAHSATKLHAFIDKEKQLFKDCDVERHYQAPFAKSFDAYMKDDDSCYDQKLIKSDDITRCYTDAVSYNGYQSD